MTDDLRDRIARAIQRATFDGANRTEDYADAVIAKLGLEDEERLSND